MKVIFILFCTLFLNACVQENITSEEPITGEFCGRSTMASCEYDEDCVTGGCSGQICQSATESSIDTCEYKECYNEQAYGLFCGCHEQKCSWG